MALLLFPFVFLAFSSFAAFEISEFMANNYVHAVFGNELHASFKLGSGGEFLVLVEPDGDSVPNDIEAVAGTLPADDASFFKVEQVDAMGLSLCGGCQADLFSGLDGQSAAAVLG